MDQRANRPIWYFERKEERKNGRVDKTLERKREKRGKKYSGVIKIEQAQDEKR